MNYTTTLLTECDVRQIERITDRGNSRDGAEAQIRYDKAKRLGGDERNMSN